ncbi:MAG: NAD(+) diphosphatase [Turicibacter sp.]
MDLNFCQICGSKLELKEIGDEGFIPFCSSCQKPYFNSPVPCVIVAVCNEENEIALIRQNYISTTSWVLIAGYITAGENAEETASREVKEETGLDVFDLQYMKSYYYEKRHQLMLGYLAKVKKSEFYISGEVDEIAWFSLDEARSNIRKGSIAYQLVEAVMTVNKNQK